MALLRSVLKDDILCELYADTYFDASDDRDNEILDSDSDVPTTSVHKQLLPCYIVFSNESEKSTEEEESSELESSDDKTSDMWCRTDEKPSNEPFLGSTGLSIVIDNPGPVEFVSLAIGGDLVQLLTEQSNLYHSQNAQNWKVSPKTLKWPNITPDKMRKFLGLLILMGQVRKENIRDYWSTDPTISIPFFPHTMSRNHFASIWQAWNFSDNSQQTQDSGQLFKMWHKYEYLVQKFRSVYSPKHDPMLGVP